MCYVDVTVWTRPRMDTGAGNAPELVLYRSSYNTTPGIAPPAPHVQSISHHVLIAVLRTEDRGRQLLPTPVLCPQSSD